MADDVTVLVDREAAYDDGTVVAVRVLRTPPSATYPDGIKYKFDYGIATQPHPIIRLDNHHGPHELHLGPATYEIDYPGLAALAWTFRAALPPDRRTDW